MLSTFMSWKLNDKCSQIVISPIKLIKGTEKLKVDMNIDL